jgi:hypothetical protein
MFGTIRILAIKNINQNIPHFSRRVNEAAVHKNAKNMAEMMPFLCFSIKPNILKIRIIYNLYKIDFFFEKK